MSIANRIDSRSIKEFLEAIAYHTEKELEYAIAFLNTYNKRRKKGAMGLHIWGGNTTKLIDDKDISKVGKADFLLFIYYDNSYLVHRITPLEVSTASKWVGEFYLKKEKVERQYDKETCLLTKETQRHLCIMRDLEDNNKIIYYLLNPNSPVYKEVIKRGVKLIAPMGGKLCYSFPTTSIKWKGLYHKRISQPELFSLGEGETE